eukprot:TRINITY_DN28670_c0_g1_i2.p1 TRINITY_DN28670_c0_g1~~TRINITY_DN28670_c0_g1_i2.p1  ORF type:complete len:1502 (+),score=366.39 TRINITY_DN28670_c0_g1_i2:454-4506(+)
MAVPKRIVRAQSAAGAAGAKSPRDRRTVQDAGAAKAKPPRDRRADAADRRGRKAVQGAPAAGDNPRRGQGTVWIAGAVNANPPRGQKTVRDAGSSAKGQRIPKAVQGPGTEAKSPRDQGTVRNAGAANANPPRGQKTVRDAGSSAKGQRGPKAVQGPGTEAKSPRDQGTVRNAGAANANPPRGQKTVRDAGSSAKGQRSPKAVQGPGTEAKSPRDQGTVRNAGAANANPPRGQKTVRNAGSRAKDQRSPKAAQGPGTKSKSPRDQGRVRDAGAPKANPPTGWRIKQDAAYVKPLMLRWGPPPRQPLDFPPTAPRLPKSGTYTYQSVEDWFTEDVALHNFYSPQDKVSRKDWSHHAARLKAARHGLHCALGIMQVAVGHSGKTYTTTTTTTTSSSSSSSPPASTPQTAAAEQILEKGDSKASADPTIVAEREKTRSVVREMGGELREVSLKDQDMDRANATKLRKKFQHIRAVSQKLAVAKDLHATFENMRATSYVGFYSYRMALQALARISRASSISKYYEQMRLDMILPDEEMMHLILSVWCKRSAKKVMHYLGDMEQLGMQLRPAVLACVTHSLAWCDDLDKRFAAPRHRVQLMEKAVALYDPIYAIGGTTLTEDVFIPFIRFASSYMEGLRVFDRMLDIPRMKITPKSINAALTLCVTIAEPDMAEGFLKVMDRFGVVPGPAQHRLLFKAYQAVGRQEDLVARFKEIYEKQRDARIAIEADSHLRDDKASRIAASPGPSSQTFNLILEAHHAIVSKVLPSTTGGNEFVREAPLKFSDKFIIQRAVEEAETLFHDAVTLWDLGGAPILWNSLLELYVVAGYAGRAKRHLLDMKKAGLPANWRCRALYTKLFNENLPDWQAMGSVEDDATLARFLTAKFKSVSPDADYHLRKNPLRCVMYSKEVEAVVLSHRTANPFRVGPLSITTVIRLYAASADTAKCEQYYAELFEYYKSNGITPNEEQHAAAATALMQGYTNARNFPKVMEVWEDAVVKHGVTPSSLLCAQLLWGLTKMGFPVRQHLDIVAAMRRAGLAITETAAVAILTACTTLAECEEVHRGLNDGSSQITSGPILGAFFKACAKEKNLEAALSLHRAYTSQNKLLRGREYLNLLNVYKECATLEGVRELRDEALGKGFALAELSHRVLHNTVLFAARNSALRARSEREAAEQEGKEKPAPTSIASTLAEESLKELGKDITPRSLHAMVQTYIAEAGDDPRGASLSSDLEGLLSDVKEYGCSVEPLPATLRLIESLRRQEAAQQADAGESSREKDSSEQPQVERAAGSSEKKGSAPLWRLGKVKKVRSRKLPKSAWKLIRTALRSEDFSRLIRLKKIRTAKGKPAFVLAKRKV